MPRLSVSQLRWTFVATLAMTVGIACDRQPLSVDATAPAVQPANATTQGATLAEIRAATAHFHQVENALAAGYVRVSPCVYNTQGTKAIHFQRPALVDAVIDPSLPEVLLYEPMKNGELRLAGVEFLIPAAAWDATQTVAPVLGEVAFMDRRTPPFGAPIPNYALYIWVWQNNPRGIYEQYNSSVSCEFADVAVIG